MADDSDESETLERIENQPYDELVEVPDGEEVASVYTPTPRNPKLLRQQQKQQIQQVDSKNNFNRSLNSNRPDCKFKLKKIIIK
jgi:hypothetical protein